ncbi:AzlC family ABC transporter permease [Risungbinella massiliensis]|uniref:AzlC family ABC transporter permease n=1 Tax=Risungbinella massiliensis TaxID=1329796 RepID=UPI000AA405FF|nr:AzlC family ABC transporter permease [Risungbinella massiliensis]
MNESTITTYSSRSQEWWNGWRAGFPIAIGYLPIAFAFGLLAKSSGVPAMLAVLLSLLVFAGASQFIAINLLAVGTAIGEIILTTFILNLRHFLMTTSLSTRLEGDLSRWWRSLISFGVTDENYSVASLSQHNPLSKYYLLALQLISFLAWNIGTWIGLLFGSVVSENVSNSMGIALYAMFIALLVPAMRNSLPITLVALVAIAIHSFLVWFPVTATLSTGWRIVLCALVASALGALFFPQKEEHHDES